MDKLYLLQGFMLGLAYVAPIGTQNMYIINISLREKPKIAFQIAFITIFFDISLALACFWGIGILVDRILWIKAIILVVGSILVIGIGCKLLFSTPSPLESKPEAICFLTSIATCFAITWLNPQALIDGSLLLGGIYSTLPKDMVYSFILGVCLASLLWFMSLATLVSFFKKLFSYTVLRVINILCGCVIIFYGIKLGCSFVELFLP